MRRIITAFVTVDGIFAVLLGVGYAQISSLDGAVALRNSLAISFAILAACTVLVALITRAAGRRLTRPAVDDAELVTAAAALRRLPLVITALDLARWLVAFGLIFAIERPPQWEPPLFFVFTLIPGTIAVAYPLAEWCIGPAMSEMWRALHARGIATRTRPLRLAARLALYSTVVVAATSAYLTSFAFSARLKALDLGAMRGSLLVFSGSVVVFALICGCLLAARFTRPILEMSEVIAQIAGDEQLAHVARVPAHQGDEIGALTARVNAMIDRLETTASERAAALRSLEALNQTLERRVDERTRQLTEVQAVAVANAHHAGMAEIATNVLHDVGNALNSVNVSCDQLEALAAESRAPALAKATELLRDHMGDLAAFLTTDPAGALLPAYLIKVAEVLAEDQRRAASEVANLRAKIQLITAAISAQQLYAAGGAATERADITQVLDDILTMQGESLRRSMIRVIKHVQPVEPIAIQRAKLGHVLLNLLKNADEAMAAIRPADRVLTIEVGGGARPFIRVRDSGEGIPPETLEKIFEHGFTTKPTGHGFGLHACATAMREMGGRIAATSDGPGRGATFSLEFDAAAG